VGLLDHLIDSARTGVEERRRAAPVEGLRERLAERDHDRPFREALSRPGMSLICEFKRRSPSAGEIAGGIQLADQVKAYEEGGAAALSILTDPGNFDGDLGDLAVARAASTLPILRKDFIVDGSQLVESAASGADAVLLIATVLRDSRLEEFQREAAELDLDCLIEVHDEDDLVRALESGAEVIGINNRNLDTGKVDVATTYQLVTDVPTGKTVVSESGISMREELDELERVGVDAALIGESLMRAADPEALVREFAGPGEQTTEHQIP
jgi:indole-3-glycerol phosphate synthase